MATYHIAPDLAEKTVAWLRAHPLILAASGAALLPDPATQIGTKTLTKSDVNLRNFAHILPDGGPGRDRYLPNDNPRLVLYAYGRSEPEAYDVYALIAAALAPYPPAIVGWRDTGISVLDVSHDGNPRRDRHAAFLVPFVRATFRFKVKLEEVTVP